MRVKIQPINVEGTPIGKDERNTREVFVGELRVGEHRINDFGRAMRVAELLEEKDGKWTPIIQLHDAVVLHFQNKQMRINGFERAGTTLYGQTWDVEVL
jgi:hypothetical protein